MTSTATFDDVIAAARNRWPELNDQNRAEFAGWVDSLPTELAIVVRREMAARTVDGWRAHPALFMHHLTGDDWWLRPHVMFFSQKYRDAVTGVSPRQIWNMPPRLGKTRILDGGQIWNMDRTGGLARSIRASYAVDLAVRSSVVIRNMIGHQEVDAQVGAPPPGAAVAEKNTQSEWYTTTGGGMIATGVMAKALGFGVGQGGTLELDDPMKDWQQAHSETQRKAVFNQYRGTFRHRLDDETCAVLVVHQRLHRMDPTGMLLRAWEQGDGDEFEVVSLPHLAEPDDPLGREVGEPIDPEAFTRDEALSRARALGTHVASAVEQQNPSDELGNELLREWFRLEDVMPAAWDQSLTSWDLKLKNNEEGDFVVGQAWVRTGPDVWLVDQLRGQYDHATTANAIALLQVRHPQIRQHVVESAGSASDVLPKLTKPQPDYVVTAEMAGRLGMTEAEQELVQEVRRQGMPGIVTHPPKGDKTVRARTWIAPTAEAGNVHLDAYGNWVPVFLDEAAAFPGGDHDDQIDAASQAIQRLQASQGSISSGNSGRRIPSQPTVATGRPRRSGTRPRTR